MVTLKDYLDSTNCEDDLKALIELIANQGETIRKAFIYNQKYADTENIYGEKQIELDKWADQHLINILKKSGLVRELASEEQPEIVEFPDSLGRFSVVVDPLDGSSLVQVNFAVGTIVGIYDKGGVLQPGKNLRAAMYLIYGPLTILTLTVREGVHIFALNEDNEFMMIEKDVKIPEGKLYASGALRKDWHHKHRNFVQMIEDEGYKLRYSGAFVADVHQFLKYGGIFSYPACMKNASGKLRLVFEANPMGLIVSQAGGKISDGYGDLLSIIPEKLDHRVPIYIGSKGVVEKLEERFINEELINKQELL